MERLSRISRLKRLSNGATRNVHIYIRIAHTKRLDRGAILFPWPQWNRILHRDSALINGSVALRKKRIKVRAEIINFFRSGWWIVAQCSFNQDHPEARPSLLEDGSLIKRRRRLPRISTPIHRPWRRVNRPALASPEGTAFKAATDHPLSPPPPRRKKTGMRATRQKRFHENGSRFSVAAHSPGKRGRWNFRGQPRDSNFSLLETCLSRASVLTDFSFSRSSPPSRLFGFGRVSWRKDRW